jgi:four helix bundle protein
MNKTPSTTATVAPAPVAAPLAEKAPAAEDVVLLDAERLHVYDVALEFHAVATVLAARADAIVRDQLRRASLSCVLNIAEGAGQRSRPQKRNLYAVARGSAMECAAIVDVLCVGGAVPVEDAARARQLLVRVVQMLTKLDRCLR